MCLVRDAARNRIATQASNVSEAVLGRLEKAADGPTNSALPAQVLGRNADVWGTYLRRPVAHARVVVAASRPVPCRPLGSRPVSRTYVGSRRREGSGGAGGGAR